MHPNNILNIGINPSVLIFSGFFILVIYFISNYVEKKLFKANKELPGGITKWRLIGIATIICLFWILFGGYGSGKPQQLTPASSDGVIEIISEAPPMLTKEEIEALEEENKPECLKELESNLSNDIDENEYINRAIKRNN